MLIGLRVASLHASKYSCCLHFAVAFATSCTSLRYAFVGHFGFKLPVSTLSVRRAAARLWYSEWLIFIFILAP